MWRVRVPYALANVGAHVHSVTDPAVRIRQHTYTRHYSVLRGPTAVVAPRWIVECSTSVDCLCFLLGPAAGQPRDGPVFIYFSYIVEIPGFGCVVLIYVYRYC